MSNISNNTIHKLEELVENDGFVSFDPICVINKTNLSKNLNEYKFDANNFDKTKLMNDLPTVSPKLEKLLNQIKNLDEEDMKTNGKLYKHVIYSEIKHGSYGARLIASGLIANNMILGYKATLKPTADDNTQLKSKKETKRYEKINMLSDTELLQTKNNNFYLLSSISVFDQPITIQNKKNMLSTFNKRPENINGDLARIIVLDSGYKEGIDLFDVKYFHIFEPTINESMQKQIIGRGTRICGQKGLEFHPTYGWKLRVFIYDLFIPKTIQNSFMDANSAIELYLKLMNINLEQQEFEKEFEKITIFGAIDYELNHNIHLTKQQETIIEEPKEIIENNDNNQPKTFWQMRKYIREYFNEFEWEPIKMENLCQEKNPSSTSEIVKYTPTQNFVRNYFTPQNPCKGILLWHSVGTGKTCSAIATATTQFEKQEYTILWVTRASLKNDIWKNMFKQVCNESIRNQIEYNNLQIPEEHKKRMKLLSKSWKIRPMSYKQFSNLVSKKNALYEALVRKNGLDDPLRKTLLIIDEAHKLFNNEDLSVLERPDMNALYESIVKSYTISGKDSVRLLLMTATPIINSPFDMIKLLNLCKPMDERIPENYDQFANDFLTQNGNFSVKGKNEYLNKITGYISYLNRSTDARQFAQPVITHIDIPIAEKPILQFDKKIVSEIENPEITTLTSKIIENNKLLEQEAADLDKNRFNFLKKEVCNEYENIPKKICDKVVNSNIKLLVNELRENTKEIRSNIKETRSQLKEHIQTRKEQLREIDKSKKEYIEEYNEYQNTPLYQIKHECSIKVDNNVKLQDKIKSYQPIMVIDDRMNEYKQQHDQIKHLEQIETNNNKDKIKQMRNMIKSQNMNTLEKSVMNMTIKSKRSENNKKMRETRKQNEILLKDIRTKIKNLSKQRQKIYNNVRKTIKKRIHNEKQKAKEEVREMKRLRKELRKQADYKENIQDEYVNSLVDKYKNNIANDLEQLDETMLETEREKIRIRTQKLEEKEARRIAAEQRRYEKELEKERIRYEKERKKEEKTRKKEEKTRKKENKINNNNVIRKTIKNKLYK